MINSIDIMNAQNELESTLSITSTDVLTLLDLMLKIKNPNSDQLNTLHSLVVNFNKIKITISSENSYIDFTNEPDLDAMYMRKYYEIKDTLNERGLLNDIHRNTWKSF